MTAAEQEARRLMDEASLARNVRESAWVRNARAARLPYKVHASVHTDVRTHVVREALTDVLRRTMPRGDE